MKRKLLRLSPFNIFNMIVIVLVCAAYAFGGTDKNDVLTVIITSLSFILFTIMGYHMRKDQETWERIMKVKENAKPQVND